MLCRFYKTLSILGEIHNESLLFRTLLLTIVNGIIEVEYKVNGAERNDSADKRNYIKKYL